MTDLSWSSNPYLAPDDAGNTQYTHAATPRFDIWRFYEVGPGQHHNLGWCKHPQLTDKPDFVPNADILLVTKGKWQFEAPFLPDGGHALTRGDGCFPVRSRGGYRITSVDKNGNGYVCLSPKKREWFDRQILMADPGETFDLPARDADTYLYLGRGSGVVSSPGRGPEAINPNRLVKLPSDVPATLEASERILGVTIWHRDTFPTSLAEVAR